jgi:hypothetical protein
MKTWRRLWSWVVNAHVELRDLSEPAASAAGLDSDSNFADGPRPPAHAGGSDEQEWQRRIRVMNERFEARKQELKREAIH